MNVCPTCGMTEERVREIGEDELLVIQCEECGQMHCQVCSSQGFLCPTKDGTMNCEHKDGMIVCSIEKPFGTNQTSPGEQS